MIDIIHARKLTRSEEIILEWNRKPRMLKRLRNGVAFIAVASTAVVYSLGGSTPAAVELTAAGDNFPAAKLMEIQQLRPQTTSSLLPLYRSALPLISTRTLAAIVSPIS